MWQTHWTIELALLPEAITIQSHRRLQLFEANYIRFVVTCSELFISLALRWGELSLNQKCRAFLSSNIFCPLNFYNKIFHFPPSFIGCFFPKNVSRQMTNCHLLLMNVRETQTCPFFSMAFCALVLLMGKAKPCNLNF